jgi:hypothetical protein
MKIRQYTKVIFFFLTAMGVQFAHANAYNFTATFAEQQNWTNIMTYQGQAITNGQGNITSINNLV